MFFSVFLPFVFFYVKVDGIAVTLVNILEFVIPGLDLIGTSFSDGLEKLTGYIGHHISVIIYIKHAPDDLILFIVDHRFNTRKTFNVIDGFPRQFPAYLRD